MTAVSLILMVMLVETANVSSIIELPPAGGLVYDVDIHNAAGTAFDIDMQNASGTAMDIDIHNAAGIAFDRDIQNAAGSSFLNGSFLFELLSGFEGKLFRYSQYVFLFH